MNWMLYVESKAAHEILHAMNDLSEARANQFNHEIERLFAIILDFPEIFPEPKVADFPTNQGVRRALVKGFSYGILYMVLYEQRVIRIVKCYHTSSDPSRWLE